MINKEIQPALYLVPVGLSEADPQTVVPSYNMDIVREIRYFVVENIRTARRWLKKCDPGFDVESVEFMELNKHVAEESISEYLNPLRSGVPVAVMSEAGCPAVADPGASLVEIAQNEGLKVIPLVGPSSILMSLIASGFNGQSFCFHGYLPIDDKEKTKVVKRLERESSEFDRTQIFIETPYRNNKMIDFLLGTLAPDTRLCIAAGLTSPEESVISLPVSVWKKRNYNYAKIPVVFLIYRQSARQQGHACKRLR